MKKSRIILILMIGILAFCFFKNYTEESAVKSGIQERLSQGAYPVYHSLDENEQKFYINICAAIESFNDTASISYPSEAACDAAHDKFTTLMKTLIYEQPQYFWVDIYSCCLSTFKTTGDYQLRLNLAYLLEKDEALQKKELFDRKVDQMVTIAQAKPNTFEQVLYVHDTILENAAYNYDPKDDADYKSLMVTAYGCLIDGSTVCSGYTLAFNLLMQKLGYECGAEFNNYTNFALSGGHVWNYCKLDGEYYYFDLTWDDTGNYPGTDYFHQFFGITTEELCLTNWHKQEDAPVPVCNGTKYNYYIYKGYNLPEYSFEAATAAIFKQPLDHITLRFDSYRELLAAEADLITNGRIHELLGNAETMRYAIGHSNLHLDIFP